MQVPRPNHGQAAVFFAVHLSSPVAAPNAPVGPISPVPKEDPPTANNESDSILATNPAASSRGIVSDGIVPQRCIAPSPSIIPPGVLVVIKKTSFFARNPQPLPSPGEVRAEVGREHPGNLRNGYSPLPVHCPHLGLTVNYGEGVVTTEGKRLWTICRIFRSAVPVPEVYGWTINQGVVFIDVEPIMGETLENQWDQLSEFERLDICRQLRSTGDRIRSLELVPGDCFIGVGEREPTSELAAHDSS